MLKKARHLTRPTLARQDAPCPKQGRRSEADPRFTFHASRFTVLGSEARTPLADFFSILLKEFQEASARTAVEGVPREATERGALAHPSPALGGP